MTSTTIDRHAEIAVDQLFHDCGLKTWQVTHRRYLVRRWLIALALITLAVVLGFAFAWIAPALIHTIHQGRAGASLLRQSIQKVGQS